MAENREALLQVTALLALKLLLAPLAVLLASLVSKRYGHVVGGVLSGFPMIAAPVTGALLLDHPSAHVTAIAFASVAGLTATGGFIAAFAWVAKTGKPWWVCLLGAALAFLSIAFALQALDLSLPMAVALGIAAPWCARFTLPRVAAPSQTPNIPASELALRVSGAFVMAAALLLSAGKTPAWLSGLLIAWPITGSILPCFTQNLIGPNATVAFFSGFSRGLVGMCTFFCTLGFLLPMMHKGMAYATALLSAAIVAFALVKIR
jgi:hypothetical protein